MVLDLRYEARDIDQNITSQAKIDQWFEAKTKGLTDLAKAQLKQRWGTMQKVLSCQDRGWKRSSPTSCMDMETRDRLKSGHGNAMLVSGSIYEACKFYELFDQTDLAWQMRHRHLLQAVTRRHQGRGVRRGPDRETAAIWHLPEDAGRLVQRAAGDGGQQGGGIREGGEEEIHRRAGADEAPDRGGQALNRLRRTAGHLSLHRQADARPRPVSGHLPSQSPGWRRQGIRLYHRLQGSFQEPGRGSRRLHVGRP